MVNEGRDQWLQRRQLWAGASPDGPVTVVVTFPNAKHVQRCEETVVRDGQPGACNIRLDERGYCGHEHDHR